VADQLHNNLRQARFGSQVSLKVPVIDQTISESDRFDVGKYKIYPG
jgi:hypothetical protein